MSTTESAPEKNVDVDNNLGVFISNDGKIGVAYAVLATDHNYFAAYSLDETSIGEDKLKLMHINIHSKDIKGFLEQSRWDTMLTETMRNVVQHVKETYSAEDLPCGYKPCHFNGARVDDN